MQTDSDQQQSTNPFQPSAVQPSYFRRVGFGPRLVAYIIDILMSTLFIIVLNIGLMQLDISATEPMQKTIDEIQALYQMLGIPVEVRDLVGRMLPALILAGTIGPLSYSLIEGLSGASPGKRVMKLLIAKPDGRAGSTMLFVRRWAVKNISYILTFLALMPTLDFLDYFGVFTGFVIFIGYFFALSESKLTLHDRIAVTAVFHRNDVTP